MSRLWWRRLREHMLDESAVAEFLRRADRKQLWLVDVLGISISALGPSFFFVALVWEVENFQPITATVLAGLCFIWWRLKIGKIAALAHYQARHIRLRQPPRELAEFIGSPKERCVLFLRSFSRESLHSQFVKGRVFQEWGEEVASSGQIERTLNRLAGKGRLVTVRGRSGTNWYGSVVISLEENRWQEGVEKLMDAAALIVVYLARGNSDSRRGLHREIEMSLRSEFRSAKTIILVLAGRRRVFKESFGSSGSLEVIEIPKDPIPSWPLIIAAAIILTVATSLDWVPRWLAVVLILSYYLVTEALYYAAVIRFARRLRIAAESRATFGNDHNWPAMFALRTALSIAPFFLRQPLEYPEYA